MLVVILKLSDVERNFSACRSQWFWNVSAPWSLIHALTQPSSSYYQIFYFLLFYLSFIFPQYIEDLSHLAIRIILWQEQHKAFFLYTNFSITGSFALNPLPLYCLVFIDRQDWMKAYIFSTIRNMHEITYFLKKIPITCMKLSMFGENNSKISKNVFIINVLTQLNLKPFLSREIMRGWYRTRKRSTRTALHLTLIH